VNVLVRFAHRKTPFDDATARHSAGRFGLRLFLISLAVLFAAIVIGLLVMRIQFERKGLWPRDLPPLPRALWLATLVLIACSATLHIAMRHARRDERRATLRALVAAMSLGLLFLLIQAWCWWSWLNAIAPYWGRSGEVRLALSGFYMLSGLHAIHVIGGLIVLGVTTAHAAAGRYTASDHAGLRSCASYWHFVDGVWVALFAYLLIAG
jgi:cytochrome c oxidase subunit 3